MATNPETWRAHYVRIYNDAGAPEYYLQTVDGDGYPTLYSDDQSWPGGHGLATSWEIVEPSEVPKARRDELAYVLDD